MLSLITVLTATLPLLLFSLTILSSNATLIPYDDTCPSSKGYSDDLQAYATIETNITDDGPLMWTIDSWTRDKPSDPNTVELGRDFYLSTPPSLDLSVVKNFIGCGIILFNATSLLQVEQSFNDYNSFSCNNVMSSRCQDDIMERVLGELHSVLNNTNVNQSFTCHSFAASLSAQQWPQTCGMSQQRSTWGTSIGAFIAGKNYIDSWRPVTTPGQNCLVNNSTAHNDLWVEGYYAIIPKGSEEVKSFQNGTTPVLTLFFNDQGQTEQSQVLSQPEIHLTCLKTVPTAAEQAEINSGNHATKSSLFVLLSLALVIITYF